MKNFTTSKLTAHDITRVAARAGIQMPAFLSDQLWQELGGGAPFSESDSRVTDLCWALVTALVLDALGTDELLERPAGYFFRVEGCWREIPVVAIRRRQGSGQAGLLLDLGTLS